MCPPGLLAVEKEEEEKRKTIKTQTWKYFFKLSEDFIKEHKRKPFQMQIITDGSASFRG